MTMVGYAKVSTREQDPAAQEWELKAGDSLVVRSPDRLAGTTTLAIHTITELAEHGINIKSLTEPDIDTTTPIGRALDENRRQELRGDWPSSARRRFLGQVEGRDGSEREGRRGSLPGCGPTD